MPARITAAPAARGHGAAPAPQAQGPEAEPPRGAEGAGDWDRDWDLIVNPLRGEALPLVMEVYGWLGLASSGTTRGMRNRPFDAVLLRRDGGNGKVPPEGPGGPGGSQEGPPGRGSGWEARQGADVAGFPDGGGGCSASRTRRPTTGFPGPCATPAPTGATVGGTRRRRSLSPKTSRGAGDGRARRRWAGRWEQGGGEGPATRDTPLAGLRFEV